MSVRVYVEGAGDYKHTDKATACRQGFQKLFEKLGLPERRLSVIACGSRSQTYNDFRTAVGRYPDDFVILLVDSEGPVEVQSAWADLRAKDRWQRPADTIEDQAHLMVQCMESWFLADADALRGYYQQGFRVSSLPRRPNVERIPKHDVVRALKNATRLTKTKGVYHKTRHGFDLLALIDPTRLRAASARARRLFVVLEQRGRM